MFCIAALVAIDCAVKLSFVDFYRQACYNAAPSTWWGGAVYEDRVMVTKRILDATALYQDYLEERRGKCSLPISAGSPAPR